MLIKGVDDRLHSVFDNVEDSEAVVLTYSLGILERGISVHGARDVDDTNHVRGGPLSSLGGDQGDEGIVPIRLDCDGDVYQGEKGDSMMVADLLGRVVGMNLGQEQVGEGLA